LNSPSRNEQNNMVEGRKPVQHFFIFK